MGKLGPEVPYWLTSIIYLGLEIRGWGKFLGHLEGVGLGSLVRAKLRWWVKELKVGTPCEVRSGNTGENLWTWIMGLEPTNPKG